MTYRSGRHFLHIPGPTSVPDRVLRAMDRPVIDHRGPEFAVMAREILAGLGELLHCPGEVFVYPASGSGAWEAALANTTSPGDTVLGFDQGFFAAGWRRVARDLGLEVRELESDWRRPVDPVALEAALEDDAGGDVRAVLVVHNETSTGVVSDIPALRAAIDRVGHPALLMVDAVSSLACMDLRQDDWGIDVVAAGAQKGLMLPPGLAVVGAGPRALEAHGSVERRPGYWDWSAMRDANRDGFFPYTPATTLLYGLQEALAMLREEGLDAVFARHARLAAATRRAVDGWGLENHCAEPPASSASVTAVLVPDGHDADALRATILERFDLSLGTGLGKLKGKVFRIGHLGDLNELTLAGMLCGVEMGLAAAGVPHRAGGVQAALELLGSAARVPSRAAGPVPGAS